MAGGSGSRPRPARDGVRGHGVPLGHGGPGGAVRAVPSRPAHPLPREHSLPPMVGATSTHCPAGSRHPCLLFRTVCAVPPGAHAVTVSPHQHVPEGPREGDAAGRSRSGRRPSRDARGDAVTADSRPVISRDRKRRRAAAASPSKPPSLLIRFPVSPAPSLRPLGRRGSVRGALGTPGLGASRTFRAAVHRWTQVHRGDAVPACVPQAPLQGTRWRRPIPEIQARAKPLHPVV